MNRYQFTFYLKGANCRTVVTTKAETYKEAHATLANYLKVAFFNRVAAYSTRLRSTVPLDYDRSR